MFSHGQYGVKQTLLNLMEQTTQLESFILLCYRDYSHKTRWAAFYAQVETNSKIQYSIFMHDDCTF